ncbi:MAG: 23S rRNA (uracil-5-)-methyltransferase RumA, partial [Bacilli bacterium]
KKLVYVSCNPSTLAKNVNHLQKAYDTKFVVPVDMFPNTPHVECIVLLERR